MDQTHIRKTVQVIVIITLILVCFGEKLKLFQQYRKTSGVTHVKTVRSLTECAVMFQANTESQSFNYNDLDKICELSGDFVENSQTASGHWKVYGRIIDGQWSAWTNWNACPVTCGDGNISRSRSCDSPAPSNGGAVCTGEATQTQTCTNSPCLLTVDGQWSAWTNWNACPVTCGDGNISRSRSCDSPAPSNGGAVCTGEATQTQTCTNSPCLLTVDGQWSAWTNWNACPVTCGDGNISRSRSCDSPAPSNGGAVCTGEATQTQTCTNSPCLLTVDGQWSAWTNWNACPVTCGDGNISRSRSCDSPAPSNGGAVCTGEATQTQTCTNSPCLLTVDGQWSAWTNWNACPVTCGDGNISRSKSCDSPAPSNGGAVCTGEATQTQTCTNSPCLLTASDFFISSYVATWDEAKATCEGMSARLAILNSQYKVDYLRGFISIFDHWFGLSCTSGTNCVWTDGTPLGTDFAPWAPQQPGDRDCVWIGYFTDKWDDDYCDWQRYFICEYI